MWLYVLYEPDPQTWGFSTLPHPRHPLPQYYTQSHDYETEVYWQDLLMMLSVLKREAVFIFEISEYTLYISCLKWWSAGCSFPTPDGSCKLLGRSVGYYDTHIFCIKTQVLYFGRMTNGDLAYYHKWEKSWAIAVQLDTYLVTSNHFLIFFSKNYD